jgi:DNA-binding transcriptional MerR regulator
MSTRMITISELAAFAGVTVRAVRHYHARGLLPEPERDASGYRRYDAQAAIDLIRIKTLAEAGVPLARVQALLEATPEQFTEALEEVDRDLEATIRRLQEHRKRVADLADADEVALPPAVSGYLELLRDLGVNERTVRVERDSWVMVCTRVPDRIEEWIDGKRKGLEDETFRELYLSIDAAADYAVDDPRLVEIADTMVGFLRTLPPQETPDYVDPTMTDMLDAYFLDTSPAWRRLVELLHERGMVGWTDIRPA